MRHSPPCCVPRLPLLQHLLPLSLPPSPGAPLSFLRQAGNNAPGQNSPISKGRVLSNQVK